MKRKKLVIISHTEHFIKDNIITGWGATINEINFLADHWETITHVACLYTSSAPKSALPYIKSNIAFVPIPPYGGKRVLDKFLILFKIPKIIVQVFKAVRGATEVQLRLPTSMGLFLLPIFAFFLPRKFTFWVKYAGNWNQRHPPLSYKIQKWWLVKNFSNCKVTINGFWEKQPNHCLSFENPCLTTNEVLRGKEISEAKQFNVPFTFCFVGRMEAAKGIKNCIEALKMISPETIEKIHFIGDGDLLLKCQEELFYLGNKVVYHGFLAKEEVHAILEQSHFILLPSKSEGFPKVIAEAACYGVVPIVSNVGSIPHYITSANGFVWEIDSEKKYEQVVSDAIILNSSVLKEKSNSVLKLAESFTFENYYAKLKTKIFES